MRFSDYIVPEAIIPNAKATNMQGIIRETSQALVDAGAIPAAEYERVVKYLLKREELGTTGIGNGIAIPETRLPDLGCVVVSLAISKDGVDFDTLDGEKVQLFFTTIATSGDAGSFLRMVEHLTRRLKNEMLVASLKTATTREAIIALLDQDDCMLAQCG